MVHLRNRLHDINRLFIPGKPHIYPFEIDDLQLKDQLGPKVEAFIHKPSNTPVVVKYIRIPYENLPASVLKSKFKQMEREIRLIRTLNSPYLVKIYGFTILGEHLLVFMERMPHSLKEVYAKAHAKGENIPEEVPKKVAYSSVQALLLFENQRPKILSRCIHPGNVLLDHGGKKVKEVKIADFGIVRELDEMGKKSGAVVYTPPEMGLYGRMDERKDVWGLGVTMLEATKGRMGD